MMRPATPFHSRSTAAEVLVGVDLAGKRIIVTGGAAGIGLETARALAGAGADVTLAVRNLPAGIDAAGAIARGTGNAAVRAALLDLADQGSVRNFVREWSGPLHVLVNNAGVMALPEQRTVQGWEMQYAINHLGHFALAVGLYPALAAAGGARIVSVSSSAHQISAVVFEDIHFRQRPYEPIQAYGQSKTANVLFAVEATRRWTVDGICTNALMPGAIPTNLQRYVGVMRTPVEMRKTPAQGASTSVLLAASPLVAGVSGRYFADCNEALPLSTPEERDITRVASYALDPEAAARLWLVSQQEISGA